MLCAGFNYAFKGPSIKYVTFMGVGVSGHTLRVLQGGFSLHSLLKELFCSSTCRYPTDSIDCYVSLEYISTEFERKRNAVSTVHQ